jgi:hypothetical protein
LPAYLLSFQSKGSKWSVNFRGTNGQRGRAGQGTQCERDDIKVGGKRYRWAPPWPYYRGSICTLMKKCNLQLISWVESKSGQQGEPGEGKCEGGGTTVLRWNGGDDGSATIRHHGPLGDLGQQQSRSVQRKYTYANQFHDGAVGGGRAERGGNKRFGKRIRFRPKKSIST